jgi:hypothetical protein
MENRHDTEIPFQLQSSTHTQSRISFGRNDNASSSLISLILHLCQIQPDSTGSGSYPMHRGTPQITETNLAAATPVAHGSAQQEHAQMSASLLLDHAMACVFQTTAENKATHGRSLWHLFHPPFLSSPHSAAGLLRPPFPRGVRDRRYRAESDWIAR